MELLIDHMTVEDVSGVTVIEEECFPEQPWSYQAFLSELENPNAITLIAIAEHEVVGFINAHFIQGEGYINNIAVTFTHRREHIADMLIKKLYQNAKQQNLKFLTLEVRVTNTPAIELYTKHDFTRVGTRKNFYDKPQEDATLMTLKLV